MKSIILSILFFVAAFSVSAQIGDSSKRAVKLQGAVNFRDLGGYATNDGKHIKWGKLYRSAALNQLTAADEEKIQSLHLSTVLDFRGPYEIKAAPDKLPANITAVNLPAGSENIGDNNYMKQMIQSMKNDSAMISFYNTLAPFHDRYKPMFDLLLRENNDSALLFHCTAGKDRTGIAAALILYALGVDEKTIMDDYLATNYYRKNENEKAVNGMVTLYGLDKVTASNMMVAKETYLNATFSAIRSNFGSVDNYLEKEMGLTKAKRKILKQKFLE